MKIGTEGGDFLSFRENDVGRSQESLGKYNNIIIRINNIILRSLWYTNNHQHHHGI